MSDERLLRTFLELVRIDSPSFSESAVAEYCSAHLRELGFEVTEDDSAAVTGSECGNLFAILPGRVPGRRLAFSGHMDTVEPCRGIVPVVGEDRVVRSSGDTVLGGDDKAGVAAILEAMRRIVESGRPHAGLQVILSTDEERGLVGAKAMDPAMVDADLVYVLDAAGDLGELIASAPTQYQFDARFVGTAAHAGVAPENGVSALHMAAEAVTAMELGRLDAGTTANIGTIHGGVDTNIVAAEATMTGECRSLDPVRVEQIKDAMDEAMRAAAERQGGSVEVAWRLAYRGYAVTEDDEVYRVASRACADVGLEPRSRTTGGGSDANILAEAGVPVLALACAMRDVHSPAEYYRVDDLEMLAALVEAIVGRAAGEA